MHVRLAFEKYGRACGHDRVVAYRQYVDELIRPQAKLVVSDEGVIRVGIRSAPVQVTLRRYHDALENVFLDYCDSQEELGLQEYVKVIYTAGLIDADLTRLECRRSFVKSQIAAALEAEEAGSQDLDGVDHNSDRSMNFGEFLTSLVRLAFDKFDRGADAALALHNKVERICVSLSKLDLDHRNVNLRHQSFR